MLFTGIGVLFVSKAVVLRDSIKLNRWTKKKRTNNPNGSFRLRFLDTGKRRGNELRAWRLLEEREKSKLKKKKKLDHESLLSVENKSGVLPRKVIEVKDNWVNNRATLDTGAVGHVMPAEMFPRVKLDRTSLTKKFGAANGKRTKD